jgi:hypothetical protein
MPMTDEQKPAPAEDDDKLVIPLDPEDALRALLDAHPEIDPKVKNAALKRLREASDGELAVFSDKLREDALRAGATEQETRKAERLHPQG